jgi:glycosyltransferase involved in cell wall biosynthesis
VTTDASRSAALQQPLTAAPLVTLAVPSFNQGQFLDDALTSIFAQGVPVEVFVADAGSSDGTLDVLHRWAPRLAGWRSKRDGGQAMAINECIALGSAPYVAWLNSDDIYLPGGLRALVDALDRQADWMAAYGNAWNTDASLRRTSRVWVHKLTPWRLAQHCMIAQPASLIRRSAWEALHGLDESLHMALDYDLWWRLLLRFGAPGHVPVDIACNRVHDATKTRTLRRRHYQEAMTVVRRHYGRVPAKWYLAWPVSVWLREKMVPQAADPGNSGLKRGRTTS